MFELHFFLENNGTAMAVLAAPLPAALGFLHLCYMFYESLIAKEIVHVLEHVENSVSSIFKLKFHWYGVYRNRLHQLSDNMCSCCA